MRFLQNENIKLRALEPEDLDLLYIWENDTQNWIHGNTLAPYSKLTLRNYIAEVQSQDLFQAKQLRLMIVLNDNDTEAIGTIDLFDFDFHNNRVGVGILIAEEYRNNNYASQVLNLVESYCFTFLKIKQLYAYIAVDNRNSLKLFEKLEFNKAGLLKDWVCCNCIYKDVFIYQKINLSL